MLSVVLIEPKNSGNVGAIARVMKNFSFSDLIIIDCKCDHLSQTARNRAKHANDVLKNARLREKSYLKNFDYLVATTAILGTDYNIPRSPVTPGQLAEKLEQLDGKKKIGLLIGRESSGLTNQEILGSDFVVTIPASPHYKTLNISHAVAVILYELFKKSDKKKSNDHIVIASKKEKEVILKIISSLLDRIHFSTEEKKETQKKVWRRLIGKSFLTKREAFALIGFLRKFE